jgi:hypothetical protein
VSETDVADHSIPLANDASSPQRKTMERMARVAQQIAAGVRATPRRIAETPDAWGTPLKYVPSDDRKSYLLVSAGADGVFDEASWSSESSESADPASDCVIRGERDDLKFIRRWTVEPLSATVQQLFLRTGHPPLIRGQSAWS